MRIFFLILGLLFIVYGCENQISTIGRDFWDNPSAIEVKKVAIDEVSTIRLDSFVTSAHYSGGTAVNCEPVIGRMEDRITGTTTAIPFCQIFSPVSEGYDNLPDISYDGHVLDSLIFELFDVRVIAGDTTTFQKFHLYRLAEVPDYDIDYPFFCSNNSVPLGEKIAEVDILPKVDNLGRFYFKIEGPLGRELFDMVARKDEILYYNYEFMQYLKGFAIVPDENNGTLFRTSSSFSLICCYHSTESSERPITLTFSNYPAKRDIDNPYTFVHFDHQPTPELEGLTRRDSLPFFKHELAVIQGLNGYMIKVKLPYVPELTSGRTIVKVDLEFKPRLVNFEEIPELDSLGVYYTDRHSRIMAPLTYGGSQVMGHPDPVNEGTEKRRYLIDVTEYYYNNMKYFPADDEMYLFIGLPGNIFNVQDSYNIMSGKVRTSFKRLIVDEPPTLIMTTIQYR